MKTIYLLFCLISFASFAQSVEEITKRISEINEVQFYGQAGEYTNFKNYKNLLENATNQELLKLLDNDNSVVVCYSSLALIHKDYSDLKLVFDKVSIVNEYVDVLSGCTISNELPAEFFYFIYIEEMRSRKLNVDDSLIKYMHSKLIDLDISDYLKNLISPSKN